MPFRLVLTLVMAFLAGCGIAPAGLGPAPAADAAPATGLATAPLRYQGPWVPARTGEAFDLAAIRSAGLSELQWVETGRTDTVGVRVIEGRFSPGAYTGPLADGSGLQTIELSSRARLYLPLSGTGPVKVAVYAAHVEAGLSGLHDVFAAVAARGVAVLVHGESSADWIALGYPDAGDQRNALVWDGLNDVFRRNSCGVVDVQTSNFPFVLARTNMLALTLANQLLEREGRSGGAAALQGGSKEGYATWLVSATDDRFTLTSPQAFQFEDADGPRAIERNSGCGPNGSSVYIDVPQLLTGLEWGLRTPEGEQLEHLIRVSQFVADLKPGFLLLGGDVGEPGMHDGNFFSVDSETTFLARFASQARPFRYDRWAGPGTAQDLGAQQQKARRFALMAHLLASPDPTQEVAGWVKVESATLADQGSAGLQVTAAVQPDADLTHVWLYWSQSPNREFNDLGQEQWRKVELARVGSTWTFVSPVFTPSAGDEVAWYVEAEETVAPGSYSLKRTDASPIQLARELPPLHCQLPCALRCGVSCGP